MQNVILVDYQWVTKSVVEKWYAKLVNKLLPNCINLHVQMHRWHLLELALAQEIEVLKTADFYHYLGILMSGFKGNNFLRIYKRYEPSFWSKEKDYSGFIRTRQYTVFTTDYYSNRGLFIPVYSVWYIYNICTIQYRFEWLSFTFDSWVFFACSHKKAIFVSKLVTKVSIVWKVWESTGRYTSTRWSVPEGMDSSRS